MNKIILENLISKNKENDTQNNKTSIPEILNPIISSRLSNRNEMNEFIESNNPFSNQNNNNNKNNNNTNNKNNNKITNNIFKNIEENLSESFNEKFPEAKKIKATLKRFYSYRRAFSKFKRKLIFTLILILNILINLDHGAIPAGTISLKLQNSLNNIKLGTIGSFTYLGLILGSISAGYIYSNYSPKWILVFSLFLSCIFNQLFTYYNNYFVMSFCRFGSAFFQVFCFIYFPLWADQYSVNKLQTIWLTFLQLGVPIGTLIGYVIEAFCIRIFNNWKYAFYNQIILIMIGDFILILTPDKFFSKYYRHSESTKEEIKTEFEDLKQIFTSKIENTINNNPQLKNLKYINEIYESKYGRSSTYSIFSMVDETEEENIKNYYKIIKNLIDNKKYIFTMLGISCMYFVVTGIQFWISDYMQEIMLIPPKKVYIIYFSVCISAPTLGVLLGGLFIQYLGGYNNNKSLDVCFKITILALISAFFLPLTNYILVFVFFMWLLLFFGGSITPGLTGIVISSIPNNVKEVGNSFTQFCYYLIGFLPSPFLYGLICNFTGGNKSKWGLFVLLIWSCFGVICIYFARKYSFDEENKKNEIPLYANVDLENYFLEKNGLEVKSKVLNMLFGGRTSL